MRPTPRQAAEAIADLKSLNDAVTALLDRVHQVPGSEPGSGYILLEGSDEQVQRCFEVRVALLKKYPLLREEGS